MIGHRELVSAVTGAERWRPPGIRWMTGAEWIQQGREMRSWDAASIAKSQKELIARERAEGEKWAARVKSGAGARGARTGIDSGHRPG